MTFKRTNPDVGYLDPEYFGDNMSSLVRVGNTVYLSGLVAMKGCGEIVAPGDVAGQLRFILDILQKMLETEEMTLANVVATTVYAVNMNQLLEHSQTLTNVFAGKAPTSTFIEVKALASPELLIEIVAIAAAH